MKVHVIGGGTIRHIRPHLALSAPAYGGTARDLAYILEFRNEKSIALHTTRMAGREEAYNEGYGWLTRDPSSPLETNDDVSRLIDELVADPTVRILFMPVALCDFNVSILEGVSPNVLAGETRRVVTGKEHPRLQSSRNYLIELSQAEKVINKVRKTRKDIFLVGFKTTTGASIEEQFEAGLRLLKTASCNLVLANDIHTKMNMIVTPEQAKYEVTTQRRRALETLVDITLLRAKGTFTRSEVVPGETIDWNSALIPDSLRAVVNHCVKRGAYKPFLGATVGHFAVKIDDSNFITSKRKTNFNDLDNVGMVRVETVGDDKVVAYGAKPSVGGQSQRIVFAEHPDTDCIVHCHVPLRPEALKQIPVQPQYPNECGSTNCGRATSQGLVPFLLSGTDKIYAVMLDKHGPNIVFHRSVDPKKVIEFIETNFDLTRQTSELM